MEQTAETQIFGLEYIFCNYTLEIPFQALQAEIHLGHFFWHPSSVPHSVRLNCVLSRTINIHCGRHKLKTVTKAL